MGCHMQLQHLEQPSSGTLHPTCSSVSRPNWYNTEFKIFTLVRKSEEAGVEFIPHYLSKLGEQNAEEKSGMCHSALQL